MMWFSYRLSRNTRVRVPWWLAVPLGLVSLVVLVAIAVIYAMLWLLVFVVGTIIHQAGRVAASRSSR
jgi:hypothetical protein